MRGAIEERTEDLNYEVFQRMENTQQHVEDREAGLYYFPTKFSLPHSKKILKNIFRDSEQKILKTPEDRKDLREALYSAIEYYLETDCEGSAVLFCPADLVDEITDISGSEFIGVERLEIKDTPQRMEEILKRQLTGERQVKVRPEDKDNNFFLRALIAYIIDEDVGTDYLKYDSESNSVFISLEKLDAVPEKLKNFYLEELGINTSKLLLLSDEWRNKVLNRKFYEYYGFLEQKSDRISLFNSLSDKMQANIRMIAYESIITRERDFNKSAEEIIGSEFSSRSEAERYRDVISELTSKEKINMREPLEESRRLAELLPLLMSEIDQKEVQELLSKARSRFSRVSKRAFVEEEYKEKSKKKELGVFLSFLESLTIISIFEGPEVINNNIDDRWQHTLDEYVKYSFEKGQEVANFSWVTKLQYSIRKVESKKEIEEEKERIESIKSRSFEDIQNAPDFVELWTKYVKKSVEDNVEKSLEASLTSKYDEFSELVVDNYNEIIEKDSYKHISDTLKDAEEDRVSIYLIIDGLGYSDYYLMNRVSDDFSDLELEEESVFSNMPSYTPSAMTTIFTGMRPEKTGVYGWTPKMGKKAFDLKKKHEKEHFEFIDHESNLSFNLIQEKKFKNSGITMLSRSISNIMPKYVLDVSSNKETKLEKAKKESYDKLRKSLKNYNEFDPERVPKKQRRDSLQKRKNIVFYYQYFDNMLHTELAESEFRNYYYTQAQFIHEMIEEFKKICYSSLDEDFEIIITGDHGKITKYENDILSKYYSFEFSKKDFVDNYDSFQAAVLNLENSNFGSISKNPIVKVSQTEQEIDLDEIEVALNSAYNFGELAKALKPGIEMTDEMKESEIRIPHIRDNINSEFTEEGLKELISWKDHYFSGSKFIFGWGDKVSESTNEKIDKWYPKQQKSGNPIFDLPDIGLLSRYGIKNQNQRDHGFHGGTALTEMMTVKLRYEGNQDGS